MNRLKSISASIVTYNSDLQQLRQAIESIDAEFSHLEQDGALTPTEITIVDNNSDDEYKNKLKRLIEEINSTAGNVDRIQLALQYQNNGFGFGHNVAAKLSSADIHLIANPDILFHNGSLAHGINELLDDERVSLVVPTIYDGNGNEQSLHCKRPKLLDIFLRSIAPKFVKQIFARRLKSFCNVPIDRKIFQTENIVYSGCLMLVNREDFLSVGGFNEKYFLYFEDYDLSLRITRKKAAKICSRFRVDHFGGNTHKKSTAHKVAFLKSFLQFSLSHWR